MKLIPNTTAEDGVLQTETDEAGYFKIENVPQIDEGYRMEIRKKNYLTRYIDNLELTEDTELSGMDFPIILWVGDFVQDDAINMEDLMKLTEYLGSYRGASDYIEDFDPNRDGVINIMDIAIVVSNFNKVPADYEKS
ncbi:MAG TPA: dockerin type I domain-containing protein [Acetivibrio sp.]|nr:dockerin type I domain-containing protein [Acetivibrio sp.]